MKRSLFILFSLLVIGCQRNTYISKEENESLFKPMIEEEIVYVSKNIEGLSNDKGKEWYETDSTFFHHWLNGANEELEGNYSKAIDYYLKALNTKRYEISSYEVKLSLGRSYIQTGDKVKARKMLNEFRQEAQKDISGEDTEWGLTEEAKEALTRDIEDCNYMLGMIAESDKP
jgi:tetratricopeptide (TPR) repeat protein